MRAVGYIRVSTEEQVSEGVSLDAQRARIAAWADANGYGLVAIHTDAGAVDVPTIDRGMRPLHSVGGAPSGARAAAGAHQSSRAAGARPA